MSALGPEAAESIYALQRFLDGLSAGQVSQLAAYFRLHAVPRTFVRRYASPNDPERPGKLSARYWAHTSMYSAIKGVLIAAAPEEALDAYSLHTGNIDLGEPGWLELQDVLLDMVSVYAIPELLTRPERQIYMDRWTNALEEVGITK